MAVLFLTHPGKFNLIEFSVLIENMEIIVHFVALIQQTGVRQVLFILIFWNYFDTMLIKMPVDGGGVFRM